MTALLAIACAEFVEPVPEVATVPPPPDEVLTPVWAERAPTAQDILRVYPPAARRLGIDGFAVLDCNVLETRALDCSVVQESESGLGFGPAALQVAELFLVKEGYPNAGPGARIRIPIRFVLAD